MSTEPSDEGGTVLPPTKAFSVLGDETRLEILLVLVKAEDQLAFSELRDRVGVRDSGKFNYHLSQLTGHFVRKGDDGYTIKQTGRRVVEAVLAGAVTDEPVLDLTPIDDPCPVCGTPILVAYREERVQSYCPECQGHYGHTELSEYSAEPAKYGYLGSLPLPPAGLTGRSAAEIYHAAHIWGTLELLAMSNRVCPRCSAPLSESRRVCKAHDATNGLCDSCGNKHAVQITLRCTNCFHDQGGALVLAVMAHSDLVAFLATHGLNPVSPASASAHDAALMEYEEDIHSVEPFEASLTFTIDGDALTLTVDDDHSVIDVTRQNATPTE